MGVVFFFFLFVFWENNKPFWSVFLLFFFFVFVCLFFEKQNFVWFAKHKLTHSLSFCVLLILFFFAKQNTTKGKTVIGAEDFSFPLFPPPFCKKNKTFQSASGKTDSIDSVGTDSTKICEDISAPRKLFTQQNKTEETQISSNHQRKKKRVHFSCICDWAKKHLLLF